MKIIHMYFSPTGGTKKVGDCLVQSWEQEAEELDLLNPGTDCSKVMIQKEDICYVSVPSFGGRVPAIVTERLEQIQGQGARAAAICVYGNRAYEDTLLELKDILEHRGFSCVAGVAAVAEHSIMHQFAQGRPDVEDKRELSQFGRKIREKIEGSHKGEELHVPGQHPYKKYGTLPMVPNAGEECNGCTLCARECPVGAISEKNPKETDVQKCIGCMHCIAACPQHARKLDSQMVAGIIQKLEKACAGRKENELFI